MSRNRSHSRAFGNGKGHPLSLPEVEASILGDMILSPSSALALTDSLGLEDFTDERRRLVFGALVTLIRSGQSPDTSLLISTLRSLRAPGSASDLERPGALVASLVNAAVPATPERVRLVRESTLRRRLSLQLQGLAERAAGGEGSLSDLLSSLEEQLADLRGADLPNTNPFFRGHLSADELMGDTLERPPFLLEGVLHRGAVGLLVGESGQGKTWLAFQLAEAIAGGDPFFSLPVQRTRVGLILLETPLWAAQERIRAIGEGSWTGGVTVRASESLGRVTLDLVDGTDRNHLAKWARDFGLGLLILDPLAFLHAQDENTVEGATAIVGALKKLAMDSGAAVLCLHHERKSSPGAGKGSDLDAVRGSSSMAAGVGFCLRLAPKGGNLCLTFPKVQSGRQPKPIYLERLTSGPFRLTDAPEEAAAVKERRKALIQSVMADYKPRTREEITHELEERGERFSDKTLVRYLSEMTSASILLPPTKRGGPYRKSSEQVQLDA